MKTIIAGSRAFNDYDLMASALDGIGWAVTEVVSGCARGADLAGEGWAIVRGIPVSRFPADWKKHHKSAGIIRNIQMAEYAEALVAFWDGKSRGTKHMIDTATKLGRRVVVVSYAAGTPLAVVTHHYSI